MSENRKVAIETTPEMVQKVYKKTRENLNLVKKRLGRPLTLAEKILYGHLVNPKEQELVRGEGFLNLQPDRLAMQDATAQMALLQFMLAKKDHVTTPTTVHCDHLIRAYKGMDEDMKATMEENKEVFNFLRSASSRYGIGFWKPGAGIIHQVVLENYAFPGGLMIGTDSHTPNAGGLAMVAVGVGGADASDVMAGLSWEVKNPKLIGVHLKGKLKGWTAAKDVILKLCGILTVKGGTNRIVEYFGEGCHSISCTGKGTVTNMGAELGATTSLFPFDVKMAAYLNATNRKPLALLAEENQDLLEADPEVLADPSRFYDDIVEIDLSTLEPHLVGPHSPDAAHPLSEIKTLAKKESWPVNLSAALIGSCTNSSYEDIERAADVAEQASKKHIKMPQVFMVSPGSSQIKKTIERDGQLEKLEKVGALVLANACGPCIGQWKRDSFREGDVNTIVNSFNRNFRGRNDGNTETLSFIASPEVVMALGLAGKLDFDPQKEELVAQDAKGQQVKMMLDPPKGAELPPHGFVSDPEAYLKPEGKNVQVEIEESSQRLQRLTPFSPWDGQDLGDLVVLCKAKGKCTTDHISPAGPWLRFRGHLDHISNNLLLGARNAFTERPGKGMNIFTHQGDLEFQEIARDYQRRSQGWIIVGDENYGEGSSREHAAMTPRHLGCRAIIARSFARIHENNLKKQGVLALCFTDPKDYDKIQQQDRVSLKGLKGFSPGRPLEVVLKHEDGSEDRFSVSHSFSKEQVVWFQKGSALNVLCS